MKSQVFVRRADDIVAHRESAGDVGEHVDGARAVKPPRARRPGRSDPRPGFARVPRPRTMSTPRDRCAGGLERGRHRPSRHAGSTGDQYALAP